MEKKKKSVKRLKNVEIINNELKKENNVKNVDEKEETLELGLYLIKNVFEEDIDESKTKFMISSIRSGNKITYEGSLVIIGDVNAGAEIIVGGNIIVAGSLRGVAHAGAMGNKKAMIVAQNIEAPQLRIANILWENEENSENNITRKYACVEDDKIKLIEY